MKSSTTDATPSLAELEAAVRHAMTNAVALQSDGYYKASAKEHDKHQAALSLLVARAREMEEALRYGDAVARLWTVHMLNHEVTRMGAHPLAMVRGALAGETNPVELGCDPAELALALETSDCDDLRAALSGAGKNG